jgi:hypothetical protein
VIARIRGSRSTPKGYVYSKYTEDEVDLFGIYCNALDRCFLLPVSMCADRSMVHLRIHPARNSQVSCINMADQYQFDGAVAQLGERAAGSRKVRGSSPLSSTPLTPTGPTTVGVNAFRDKLVVITLSVYLPVRSTAGSIGSLRARR